MGSEHNQNIDNVLLASAEFYFSFQQCTAEQRDIQTDRQTDIETGQCQ